MKNKADLKNTQIRELNKQIRELNKHIRELTAENARLEAASCSGHKLAIPGGEVYVTQPVFLYINALRRTLQSTDFQLDKVKRELGSIKNAVQVLCSVATEPKTVGRHNG